MLVWKSSGEETTGGGWCMDGKMLQNTLLKK